MYVEGVVKDTEGQPVANATIDTWETDGTGLYDTQVSSRNLECTISSTYPASSTMNDWNLIVEEGCIPKMMGRMLSVQSCTSTIF